MGNKLKYIGKNIVQQIFVEEHNNKTDTRKSEKSYIY